MTDMKERILLSSLRLFARDGYEAVSVSEIAGELGVTKGALYRHYASKRAIFDAILERMARRDAEGAAEYGLPEGTRAEMEEKYRSTELAQLIGFARAQFRYWTQDEFAAQFRKMLTLEQHRSGEMMHLYQQYLVSGPLDYTAQLLDGMGVPRPRVRAAEIYAPMFLFYGVYDGAEDKARVTAALDDCLDAAGALIAREIEEKRGKD